MVRSLRIIFSLLGFFSLSAIASFADPLVYGGQYYPEEFVLKQMPEVWTKYGLDVEHILFSSGADSDQALISGQIQINCGSDSRTASLLSAIPDEGIILATIQKGDRYATVVSPSSSFSDWNDLKGQMIAVRLGTGAEQILRRFFAQDPNLAWEDFKWVNLKIEDMIPSLQAGRIAAFTAWEPTCGIAEAQGAGKILKTYGEISTVPVSLHTTRAYAENNRDIIIRFLAAHLEKVALIESNPEEAAKLAAEYSNKTGFTVQPEAFISIFKRINFSLDVTEKDLESIKDTAKMLHDGGQIANLPNIVYDPSYLEEAKKLYEEKKTN